MVSYVRLSGERSFLRPERSLSAHERCSEIAPEWRKTPGCVAIPGPGRPSGATGTKTDTAIRAARKPLNSARLASVSAASEVQGLSRSDGEIAREMAPTRKKTNFGTRGWVLGFRAMLRWNPEV